MTGADFIIVLAGAIGLCTLIGLALTVDWLLGGDEPPSSYGDGDSDGDGEGDHSGKHGDR